MNSIECSIPSDEVLQLNNKFSLSLAPSLLLAKGNAIDLLIKSKVASYLQFGMLNGIGIWNDLNQKIERVPGSKAGVFSHPTLSLVEKRRLTKLLLLAAGEDELSEDDRIKSGEFCFRFCS